MSTLNLPQIIRNILLMLFSLTASTPSAVAKELDYFSSNPRLDVEFAILNGHYNGQVNSGNLFIAEDIPNAPTVKWKQAKPGKLYTLLMLDLDGNANGSYPDKVPLGDNSPIRHWIVGNIPAQILRNQGYQQSQSNSETSNITVLQPYRQPQIVMVSDRYGIYLFEQKKQIHFAKLEGDVVKFDYAKFIQDYSLGQAKASDFFVAIYTTVSPFSGKAFSGHNLSKSWHKDLGKGQLPPSRANSK